jgi:hypothetical protein
MYKEGHANGAWLHRVSLRRNSAVCSDYTECRLATVKLRMRIQWDVRLS